MRRFALCATAALLLLAAPAVAGAVTWTVQSVPAMQSANGQGISVSCVSATACTEVGYAINPLGLQQPSAQAWNGTSWATQTVPLPSGVQFGTLRGVSCTSATACTAVGGTGFSEFPNRPLAERWNGTGWTIQTVPLPSGASGAFFNSVSCSAASACMAVGGAIVSGRSVGIAESWNGTAWTVQTVPNPASPADVQLNGVACTSASACIAVGHFTSSSQHFFPDQVVAEVWNGTSWAIQTTPLPSGTVDATLAAVSCSASTACTAVGGYATTGAFPTKTLAERWNGTSWAVETTPNPTSGTPSLSGVSCPTATDCTAVGGLTEFGNTPVAEQWNGTSWSLQSAQNPSGLPRAQLSSVSCTATTACTAVGGAAVNSQAPPRTLAERWNGTAWALQSAQDNRGALPSEVSGVSCATASSCVAVGDFNNTVRNRMLAETWDGNRWTPLALPLPANTAGVLNAVSCMSPTACTAVGNFVGANSVTVTLAERWNGSAWTVQATPNPTGSTNATLEAVSCASTTFCMAVGKSLDGATGRWTRLALQWNGTSWALNPTPNVTRETFSELTGISCPSATACMAVGGYSAATGAFRSDSVFAEQWDGSGWRVFTPHTPTGTTYANFTGVSCTAANACTAAGGFATGTGDQFPSAPLAERWAGNGWAIQTTPNPTSIGFSAGACATATACTAVGSDFAEGWDGTSWTAQTLPFVSQGEAELSGVSCTAASACTATGRIVQDYLTVPLSARSVFIQEMFVPLAERSSATSVARATVTAARPPVRVIRLGGSPSHSHELAVLGGR